MSQYIEFFVRSKTDEFIPLLSFSRSNYIYQLLQDTAPYEAIRALTIQDIERATNELNLMAHNIESVIRTQESTIQLVMTSNNKLEEKMEIVHDLQQDIYDLNSELKELHCAGNTLDTLASIIENVRFEEDYDFGRFVYVGIEVGSPTMEDVR